MAPAGEFEGEKAGAAPGVDRDVLEAVMLLAALRVDEPGDVELEAVQVHAIATRTHVGDQGRTEVVDVELHRLLGIARLHVHVMSPERHEGSPSGRLVSAAPRRRSL